MTSPKPKWVEDLFPLRNCSPRPLQTEVIASVDRAFADGFKFVVLEAPVGSGKSAMALTLAKKYGKSHVLTPRKALQDQYFSDFSDFTFMMKGKNAYPCKWWDDSYNNYIYEEVRAGRTPSPSSTTTISVAEGKCRNSYSKLKQCISLSPCPYLLAAEIAEHREEHILHNNWGFMFQAPFKFSMRDLLVVDEAHDLEGIIRDHVTVEFIIRKSNVEIPSFEKVEDYIIFFSNPALKPKDEDELEKYETALTKLAGFEDRGFVVDHHVAYNKTYVTLKPINVSGYGDGLLWRFGKRILLMSGTIYDKPDFCRRLGIPTVECTFLRVDSEFPLPFRPVLMKPEYQVDTSHKNWDVNFGDLVKKIELILSRIPDAKGLIHTPSYKASEELLVALRKTGRVVSHTKENFQQVLDSFFESTGNQVLLSPVCTQGVDFKGNRAAFQIIVRVPWLNAGDKFVKRMMEDDFPWYNLQALRVFGQQLGRINRFPGDYGATFLIDSRFNSFINRNRKYLPKWQLDAIVTK